jgi:hypothetical protein
MTASKARTVGEYMAALPPERRKTVEAVRKQMLANLPDGYEESMQSGMIGYTVPLSRFPNTYNGAPLMYAALGAQKNYTSVYLMGVYADPDTRAWFEEAYRKAGKKLDMGQSCVRFKTLDDVPLDVIGDAIARTPVDEFIARYGAARKSTRNRPKTSAEKKTPKRRSGRH